MILKLRTEDASEGETRMLQQDMPLESHAHQRPRRC